MSLAGRLLFDLGSVEQRRDDGGRTDADRDSRLHELCPPLLAGFIPFAVIGHVKPLKRSLAGTSIGLSATLEAAR